MNFREKLQDGAGRGIATFVVPVGVTYACWCWWPGDAVTQDRLLSGFQKVAFVAGAFAVTAYNLRARVVDLVLKVEGQPLRVEEFCRIARNCGKRLTNLVILFTLTSIYLGALTLFDAGTTSGKFAVAGALGLFAASMVSFVYIVFSFERVERFALDEAEKKSRKTEAERLLEPAPFE